MSPDGVSPTQCQYVSGTPSAGPRSVTCDPSQMHRPWPQAYQTRPSEAAKAAIDALVEAGFAFFKNEKLHCPEDSRPTTRPRFVVKYSSCGAVAIVLGPNIL